MAQHACAAPTARRPRHQLKLRQRPRRLRSWKEDRHASASWASAKSLGLGEQSSSPAASSSFSSAKPNENQVAVQLAPVRYRCGRRRSARSVSFPVTLHAGQVLGGGSGFQLKGNFPCATSPESTVLPTID
jgi:hypothetical protein